ncbi:MAG: hypothetical protein JRN23_06460 [Nitrososphaerota archaeon]|nr:hypothetical protein [Nitrososphaerota archaeon]
MPSMPQTENGEKLAAAEDFDGVFELVKKAVDRVLGVHRAGLSLVLGDLSNEVGAYHEMGSNAIVMNRNIMKIVWGSTRSRSRRNSYTFMILLHEYLHALGFADDGQVRGLSKKITDEYVGEGHLAGEMAVGPLDRFFPEIGTYAAFRDNGTFETVRKFDSSSTPYIA